MIVFITLACNKSKNNSILYKSETEVTTKISVVKTQIVDIQNSGKKKSWVGKISHNKVVDYVAQTSGVISKWNISHTLPVKKNSVLVEITDPMLEYETERLLADINASNFNKNAMLVDFGGQIDQIESVNKNVQENILIKTKYYELLAQKKKLEIIKSLSKVTVSDDGWVLDDKKIIGSPVSIGEKLFSFIPKSAIFVIVKIPQIEYKLMPPSPTFIIEDSKNSYSSVAHIAFVRGHEGEYAHIDLYLNIQKLPNNKYIEGYNVSVSTQAANENVILIPKTAVVERDGLPTVFTYDATSRKAVFNSVTILDWDHDYYLIQEGIKVGDEIIVEGNHLLTHNTPVQKQ